MTGIREERKVGKPRKINNSEDLGVDGRMESEWILGRLAGGCGVDSVGCG
jgi:hypothetical protein